MISLETAEVKTSSFAMIKLKGSMFISSFFTTMPMDSTFTPFISERSEATEGAHPASSFPAVGGGQAITILSA